MIHYTCDRCKRTMDPENEVRYTVRLEVIAVLDSIDSRENEDDRDHLLEVEEVLSRLEDSEDEEIGEDVFQRKVYDLCPRCYRKFKENPLGSELATQFGFSEN